MTMLSQLTTSLWIERDVYGPCRCGYIVCNNRHTLALLCIYLTLLCYFGRQLRCELGTELNGVLWVDIVIRTCSQNLKLFPVNYEAGVVIGLAGEPYCVDTFIHRTHIYWCKIVYVRCMSPICVHQVLVQRPSCVPEKVGVNIKYPHKIME